MDWTAKYKFGFGIVFIVSFLVWWFVVGCSISRAVHTGDSADGELLGFAFGWIGALPCALITALLWPIVVLILLTVAAMNFWKEIERLAIGVAVTVGTVIGMVAVNLLVTWTKNSAGAIKIKDSVLMMKLGSVEKSLGLGGLLFFSIAIPFLAGFLVFFLTGSMEDGIATTVGVWAIGQILYLVMMVIRS